MARASSAERSRSSRPLAIIRATMSARVERSMPVIRTRSVWVAPSCSAAAASTANWRWVIAAGAELLGVDVERQLQRAVQQMARRPLQGGEPRPWLLDLLLAIGSSPHAARR